jgi:integrase
MRNGRTEGRIFTFHPNTLVHHIHKVCATAGITDTTVHGLRHTNAAVMRYLGVSDAYAMERGGWTEERTYKNIYSYVFDSTANKEGQIIDDFFGRKAKNVR